MPKVGELSLLLGILTVNSFENYLPTDENYFKKFVLKLN